MAASFNFFSFLLHLLNVSTTKEDNQPSTYFLFFYYQFSFSLFLSLSLSLLLLVLIYLFIFSDFNECAINNGGCNNRSYCINEPGTFRCSACPAGLNPVLTNNGGCIGKYFGFFFFFFLVFVFFFFFFNYILSC